MDQGLKWKPFSCHARGTKTLHFCKISKVNKLSGYFDKAFYSNTSKFIFLITEVSELKDFSQASFGTGIITVFNNLKPAIIMVSAHEQINLDLLKRATVMHVNYLASMEGGMKL